MNASESSTDTTSKSEKYGLVVAALTDAIHNLSLVQIDFGPEMGEQETNVLAAAKQSILKALGTNEEMGLGDLLGMRAIDGWIEGAIFDGAYGDYAVYRYNANDGIWYSAPELNYESPTGTTVSVWFKQTEPLIQMLIHSRGALPHLSYQVAPAS